MKTMIDMCKLVHAAVGVFDGLRNCRNAALDVVFDALTAQSKQF